MLGGHSLPSSPLGRYVALIYEAERFRLQLQTHNSYTITYLLVKATHSASRAGFGWHEPAIIMYNVVQHISKLVRLPMVVEGFAKVDRYLVPRRHTFHAGGWAARLFRFSELHRSV